MTLRGVSWLKIEQLGLRRILSLRSIYQGAILGTILEPNRWVCLLLGIWWSC